MVGYIRLVYGADNLELVGQIRLFDNPEGAVESRVVHYGEEQHIMITQGVRFRKPLAIKGV